MGDLGFQNGESRPAGAQTLFNAVKVAVYDRASYHSPPVATNKFIASSAFLMGTTKILFIFAHAPNAMWSGR